MQGVQQVKDWIVTKLPEGPTLYPKGVVSEQPERFFVAELIREKVFLLYSQEIPYSVQVRTPRWEEGGSNVQWMSIIISTLKNGVYDT